MNENCNCEECYLKGVREYAKEQIKAGIDFFRWDIIIFRLIVLLFSVGFFYQNLGVIGIFIGILAEFVFYFLTGTLEGGAVGDWHNEYPIQDPISFKCSAGIEDCKICGNEYSHEFNLIYNKKHKWYNF